MNNSNSVPFRCRKGVKKSVIIIVIINKEVTHPLTIIEIPAYSIQESMIACFFIAILIRTWQDRVFSSSPASESPRSSLVCGDFY